MVLHYHIIIMHPRGYKICVVLSIHAKNMVGLLMNCLPKIFYTVKIFFNHVSSSFVLKVTVITYHGDATSLVLRMSLN